MPIFMFHNKKNVMKVAVVKCGKMTATMELSADGLVSVYGRTAQKRGSELEFPNLRELPMSDVMILRDRRSVEDPLPEYLQAIVNEIWAEIAEDEPWFSFCCPSLEAEEA